jgi:hypothetical protein
VSTFSRSQSSQRRVHSVRTSRRITRFPLHCEGLESRQLLSIGQGSLTAAALPATFTNPAAVFNPPVVLSLPGVSFSSIQFEIGSLSGFNVQISFGGNGGFSSSFGGGQVFTPAPAAPTFEPGLGALTGIIGSGLTSGNTSSGSNFGNLLLPTPTSTSSLSITPLNPNLTSSSSPAVNPVIVPPPLQPLVVHLTASASPVTNIAFSSLVSLVEEQPTAITHFGQSPDLEQRSVWFKTIREEAQSSSLIDWVEPVQPAVPADGEKIDGGQPADRAPAPAAARPRSMPGLTDRDVAALFDLGEEGSRTSSDARSTAQSDNQSTGAYYSWSLSTVFGATVVAAGGYQLAIREADRFKARWTPRWIGAERPTRRKSGSAR